MLPRFKSLIVLTFIVFALYVVFWRDEPFSGQHAVDVLKGFGEFEVPWGTQDDTPPAKEENTTSKLEDSGERVKTNIEVEPIPTSTSTKVNAIYFTELPADPEETTPVELEHGVDDTKDGDTTSSKTAAELVMPTSVPGADKDYGGTSLQKQFDKEYDDLGLNEQEGAIYGNTINALVDVGAHEGFAAAAIKPSKSSMSYSDALPYTYNPYPEYNSKAWQTGNQGVYKACSGPNGPIADLLVYSGHPKAFSSPQMGSYIPLDIDSNLCFERETRLGPYGFQAEVAPQGKAEFKPALQSNPVEERDASKLDWGALQKQCYKANFNRYSSEPELAPTLIGGSGGNFGPGRFNGTAKVRPSSMARRLDTLMKKVLGARQAGENVIPDKVVPIKEEIPGFQPEGFVEALPTVPYDEHKEEKEKPTSEEEKVYSVGWEKYNKADSDEHVPELIESGGDMPTKEKTLPHDQDSSPFPASDKEDQLDKSPFSGFGDKPAKEDTQHDYFQGPDLDEDKDVKEPEKGAPKFPALTEEAPEKGLTEDEAKIQGLHGMPEKTTIKPTPRTAVIIRTYSHLNFTDNDKQNIRAMVSELSLRSGGEYEIFLLVEWKDETLPIFSDKVLYREAVEKCVPKEFAGMTVLWNGAKMRETYPLIPREVNNVHQSQWLSVQWFAQEHPEFQFYWNWEFDTRYTGHYYNLLEKLAGFAKAQPRKGLWERNERYYIPSYHGRYSKFTKMVEKIVGTDTVWGAPPVVNVTYIGSGPPVKDPKDDKYVWGVGEDADYISLSPIFNPVNTTWPGRNDVWGYDGPEKTPRRATIGTQSRCSKKLLDTMHAENKKGNHVSSEMTPQTVSLLHGLKAVYAPIPMFFDRPWAGESLQRYFNPGPKGQSGSVEESPYSWGKEVRFQGSTWYYRAMAPMRLYNNWLGWEDTGIGGAEWEKKNGRMCLPPLLLHPIKDVVQPPPGTSSKSELPY